MNEFAINESAEIENINARKVGKQDNRVLALDVRLSVTVPHGLLSVLMGNEPGELARSFWTESAMQEPRFLNIAAIKTPTETQFGNLVFRAAGSEYTNCTAKKFEFVPIAGRSADLTFTLSIPSLDEDGIGILAEYLKEEIGIDIRPEQESLPIGDQDHG